MASFPERIAQVHQSIRHLNDAGAATAAALNQLADPTAELLLLALKNPRHPLAADFKQLAERVRSDPEGEPCRDHVTSGKLCRNPNRHYFVPQPGNPQHRRCWRLQVLFQVASHSRTHLARLARVLGVASDEIPAIAQEAATASSTAFWSRSQLLDRLSQALEQLAEGDPGLPIRLEGRTVHCESGETIELSEMLAKFLGLLIQDLGKPVIFRIFTDVGISYPTKAKHFLLKRLNEKGIHLHIRAGNRELTLLPE